jgi:hypothetical protein
MPIDRSNKQLTVSLRTDVLRHEADTAAARWDGDIVELNLPEELG